MPTDMTVQVNLASTLKTTLANLADLRNQPAMNRAKLRIGVVALQDQRRHFREQSDGPGKWPPLSDTTVVMRKGGPMIFTDADIAAKRSKLKTMRDSNRLYVSLTPEAPDNVFNVLPSAVQVGTNVSYAKVHQTGGRAQFTFGEEEKKRFAKNVSATRRGFSKPRKRKAGARRWPRGKSPWNPLYFKLRGAFRKMDGKSFRVPRRKFLIAPPRDWTKKYARIVAQAIKTARK